MSTAVSQISYSLKGRNVPVTDKYYREAMENSASYNTRIVNEKKMRLPFIDTQTGLAQNHSNLYFHSRFRSQGVAPGQIYSYPAKRWKKKKRPFVPLLKSVTTDSSENGLDVDASKAKLDTQEESSEPPNYPDVPMLNTISSSSRDAWYEDYETIPDTMEMGADLTEYKSDDSDYDQPFRRKRKKKPSTRNSTPRRGGGRSKKSTPATPAVAPALTEVRTRDEIEDFEKPFVCDSTSFSKKNSRSESKIESSPVPTTVVPDDKVNVNSYCDFCLGDQLQNKKTGVQEKLVSCADCGRSGHPSCLQFTANMVISVSKYPWQCIECKSCGLCGTSDNDDQLLFCDDCDRGYHMYCLQPPLTEPPEGSWSCHLCVVEFHQGKKHDNLI